MRATRTHWSVLLLVLQVLLLGVATADWVEFNREVVRAYNGSTTDPTPTRFMTDATDAVLDPSVLQSYVDDLDIGRIPIQCDSTSEFDVHCSDATVLIAISRCLTPASVAVIRDWVVSLRRPTASTLTFSQPSAMTSADNARTARTVTLRFQFTLIPVTCDVAEYNQSPQFAMPSVRLRTWTTLGRVSATLPTLSSASEFPIAVVSFIGGGLLNDRGYEDVQRFARSFAYTTAINVQLCEAPTLTTVCLNVHRLRNAVLLPANADALRSGISLFRTIARVSCDARLPGGRPVPYAARSGQSAVGGCICVCPAGTTRRVRLRGDNSPMFVCEDSTPPPCDDRCVWSRFGPFVVRDSGSGSGARCPLEPIKSLPLPFVAPRTELVERDPTPTMRRATLRLTRQNATLYSYDELITVLTTGDDKNASVNRFGSSPNVNYLLTRTRPTELTDAQRQQLRDLRVNGSNNSVTVAVVSADLNEYRSRGLAAFDAKALSVRAYGRYDVEMTIAVTNDSRIEATCRGCVSVVDMARPQATTPCPRAVCESNTAVCPSDGPAPPLTTDTLQRANAAVTAFYQFQSQAQDPSASCLDTPPARCDLEKLEMKDFFDVSAAVVPAFARGRDCFRAESVQSTFLQRVLSRPPLFEDEELLLRDVPVSENDGALACTRCCALETAIRERWIDYRCDSAFDTERCDGLATERCALRQCLALRTESLVSASASIRPSLVTASQAVLDKHVSANDRAGFETVTQIHYAVPASCGIFSPSKSEAVNGECVVVVNPYDLLTIEVSLLAEQWQREASDEHRRRLVDWRYLVAGADPKWRRLAAFGNAAHTFRAQDTKITVEAWTPCGLVRRFFFRVLLHPAAPTDAPPKVICPLWNGGWYQSSAASRLPVVRAICTHPRSSFAELTLDVGSLELQKTLRRVQCDVSVDGRNATTLVTAEAADGKTLALVRRFALQLRDAPETTALTAVEISCRLTLRGAEAEPRICTKQLLVQSCDPPRFDCDGDDSDLCRFQNCVTRERERTNARRSPAPFEICGGYRVSATNETTVVELVEAPKCCTTCGPSECRSILQVPQPLVADLRWCTAPPVSNVRVEYYRPYYRGVEALLGNDAGPWLLRSLGSWSVVGAMVVLIATVAITKIAQEWRARRGSHEESVGMEPLLRNAM
ncbi:hypothetical protein PINS_up008919 [Pythium insidiosum]|nr:hypothetical protein PINS_up008919 [Pythium insidiosum]